MTDKIREVLLKLATEPLYTTDDIDNAVCESKLAIIEIYKPVSQVKLNVFIFKLEKLIKEYKKIAGREEDKCT